MTSQLAKQLAQLQTRPDGDQHLAKSFLFSNSDAKQISREQIHDLATSGLRTLLAIDNRFAPFLEPLFGQSTVRRERSMFTSEQNADVSAKIKHVCALLSPHLFVIAAQQVFEYLVRVYEVHTYDVQTVLSMFLPYHDHAIFGRVIMLLDLRSTGFDFLAKNQESGTILPRSTLVTAAAENGKVMRLVCEIAADAVKYEVSNNAAFALLAGVSSQAATRQENDAVLRIILPFLVAFLEEPHPIATPTAILIACVWCQEGSMTPKALAAILRPLIASLTMSQYPVPLAERLAAIGHVFKYQSSAIHDIAFSPILELLLALPSWQDWWAASAISSATAALTHRLLDYCLVQLRNEVAAVAVAKNSKLGAPAMAAVKVFTASDDIIQFLCVACTHMTGLTKKDVSTIFNAFVIFLSSRLVFAVTAGLMKRDKNRKDGALLEKDEVSALISTSLKALERRFPLIMDEAISEALAAAMVRPRSTAAGAAGAAVAADGSSEPVAFETISSGVASYDALINFIAMHFSGTKYEMIELPSSSDTAAGGVRKAPLLTCILHQVPEIRSLAFVALKNRVEKEGVASSLIVEMIGAAKEESDDANEDDVNEDEKVTKSTAAAAAVSNLLPLIRHAIEVETSTKVASDAIAFARVLIATATTAKKNKSKSAAVAVAVSDAITALLASLYKMISSSVGEVMFSATAGAEDDDDEDNDNAKAANKSTGAASASSAAFIAILGEIIAAESSSVNKSDAAAASPKRTKTVGGKAPTGITAAAAAVSTEAEDAAAAAVLSQFDVEGASSLLSRAVYYLTTVACAETGLVGTTTCLQVLFEKLGLPKPAGGFAVAATAASSSSAAAGSSAAAAADAKKKKAADSSDDSDDEDKKRPKLKIGDRVNNTTTASSTGSKASSSSAFAPVELATSYCPAALFAVTNTTTNAGALIIALIAKSVTLAELAAITDTLAIKKSLLNAASESDDYTSANTKLKDGIQVNMMGSHVAEAAVLAATVSFGAASSSATDSAAHFVLLGRVMGITAVVNSSTNIANPIPTVATALGLRAGLYSALLLTKKTTTSAASTTYCALTIAKLLAVLVTRFKQPLPALSLVPAGALWSLSSLATTTTSAKVSSNAKYNSDGIIRVPLEMGIESTQYGLTSAATRTGLAMGSRYHTKDTLKMGDDRSVELYTAVIEAVFAENNNTTSAAAAKKTSASSSCSFPVAREGIAFALLIPTMAPLSSLRQTAVEKLQSSVLTAVQNGSGKASTNASSSSFIGAAVRQLTAAAQLSVTSVNSLVEVLAQSAAVKNSACLTEDMATAVLKLLLEPSADAAAATTAEADDEPATAVSLSPSFISNALNALFLHNKRSAQKHGELVLSKLLPIFVRPTIAKAGTSPLTVGEAELLFAAANLVNFAGVTSVSATAPLEATCEVAALCLNRSGVRIINDSAAAGKKSKNVFFFNSNGNGNGNSRSEDDQELLIRSVFVPVLAALSNVSPKLLEAVAAAAAGKATADSFVYKILTPSVLLREFLVPLFEKSGAVTSDVDDTTTAAQHVVYFLTSTSFGFNSILTPVLPALIQSRGIVGSESEVAETAAADRKVGKKDVQRAAGGDDEQRIAKKKRAKFSTAAIFSQLVELASEVVAFLGTVSSSSTDESKIDTTKAGAMMADGAAASVQKLLTASSGIVVSHNSALDAATISRLFKAAFSALRTLPVSVDDIAASGEKPSAIVTAKVNLLKFLATLVQAAPSADGYVRENPLAKTLDRLIVAVDSSEVTNADAEKADKADDDNAAEEKKKENTSNYRKIESALGYILRTFEMNAMTPFLLGLGASASGGNSTADAAVDGSSLPTHTVSIGSGHNNITLGSGSMALTLSAMRAVQMLIATVTNNSVAIASACGKDSKKRAVAAMGAKHSLVRQSLMLLTSLFVVDTSSSTAASANDANVLVSVVSQLLHVIGPLLSGAHAAANAPMAITTAAQARRKAKEHAQELAAAVAAKDTTATESSSASSTLGAATSLLHIPLMALYLRLDASAAARQQALVAAGATNVDGSALLADGGADYFVSNTLLETPIDICVKILTSFPIEEQMAALCGLMELVCSPSNHVRRISAAATEASIAAGIPVAETSGDYANAVAELCGRLVNSGLMAKREEPILTLISRTIKSEAFLGPFVALQHADSHRRMKIIEEERRQALKNGVEVDVSLKTNNTSIDNSTNCANLLVASLNLYAHFHGLNARKIAAQKAAKKQNKTAAELADDAELSDVESEEDASDDVFTEEKAFSTLLELLAGNCLACVLAAINEPTFVDCQRRMLSSTNVALRQKGLETLLDRLHQSLPTYEEESAVTGGGGVAKKSNNDPRSRAHLLDVVQLRARPQTTKLSADLLPFLSGILRSSLNTEKLFSVQAAIADERIAASEKAAAAAATAAAVDLKRISQKQHMNTVQIALSCVEELTRIVGAGGSNKADKVLAKPQLLGGAAMSKKGSDSLLSEANLVTLFASKARLQDLHTIANYCLSALQEWGTALSLARKGASGKSYTKSQQVLATALLTPNRTFAQHKATMQSLIVLSGACLNVLATLTRTLSVVFSTPHANDILKTFSSWMSIVMLMSTTTGGNMLEKNSIAPIVAGKNSNAAEFTDLAPPTIDNMFVSTRLNPVNVCFATMYLFNNFRLSASDSPCLAYLRKVLLHSIYFALPSTWTMSHPYIPTFVSFATHNCNVNDAECVDTSANFLSSLRAVLGDRGLLECICSSLINNNIVQQTADSVADEIVPVTPTTHSMRLIFIFVEKILVEMSKEDVATMPVLITGSGADEASDIGVGGASSAVGKNFWLTAFGALAGAGGNVPSADAMEPVFNAYTAFFIKFKEKTCAQFWTKITDWAVNRQGGAVAATAGNNNATKDKRLRTEDGDANSNNTRGEEERESGGGYTKKQVVGHFVYLSLYNHLLRKLKGIMTFSFPIVSNVLVEFLQRYNPTPFVNFSSAISANDKKIAAAFGGAAVTSSDNTGGAWILKNKIMGTIVFAATSALMQTVLSMSDAMIPEDPTLAARTGVQHDVFFAKVDVFNTFMPLIFSHLSNTQVFSFESTVGAESSSLGFYKRAERSIVPAIRKFFAALNGPKLWSLSQKELIKYLRHPKAAVRKATLLALQLCYRDGGDVLCSFIMAEGLPAIVEMTEDNDKEVVEQARLLCSELSTITGQDVLNAMA